MTPTESQKREALEWADAEMADLRAGILPKTNGPVMGNVLAHFLRLAESELAEARREVERMENRLLHRGDIPLREEISALRAENEALRQANDGNAAGALDYKRSCEAAEAKVARLAEALKESNNALKRLRDCLEGKGGPIRMESDLPANLEYGAACYDGHKAIISGDLALRETEGGASK